MNTDLNPSLLPLNQPYNVAPWNYSGSESVPSIPNAGIVDWLLIDVRDAENASLATSETTVAQQAAFINQNGEVVGLDGSSNLIFEVSISENLFVVINHRNHLSVMSAVGLERIGSIYSYDFTGSQTQAYGGNLKVIGPLVWGMYGGNGFADGQIDELDKTSVWDVEAGKAGYLQGDYNMDGQVDNLDKNDLWLDNNGIFSEEYQLIWQDEFDVDGIPDPDK
jgi:hypothetical protein